MSRLRSLAFRLYGEPPPKGSPRVEMLRWIRGIHLRMLPLWLITFGTLLVWADEAWIFVVAGVSLLTTLESLISLSVKIGREERRERG